MVQQQADGISFVFPFFNQTKALDSILTAWSAMLVKLGRPFEILLVDDGSTDAVSALFDGENGQWGLLKRIPHVKLLRHPLRQGYGACLRTALLSAQHPLIFYTGCDHPYQPADLKTMLQSIEEADPVSGEKIDLVSGFRATTPLPRWRRNLGLVYRLFLRIAMGVESEPLPGRLSRADRWLALKMRSLFGVRMHDVNSRFKLIRKRIFDRFPIQSDGDFVHGEILAKANFLGCMMVELPIAERPGPIPVSPEPAPPTGLGKELRTVFKRPIFTPPPVAKTEPIGAAAEQPPIPASG